MAQWVKLSGGWLDLEQIAAVTEDGRGDLSLFTPHQSVSDRSFMEARGEDAALIKDWLNAQSSNVGHHAFINAGTEAIEDAD